MHWLHTTPTLDFDYYLTLGGAVYPLHSAKALAQQLQQSKAVDEQRRHVWLGSKHRHVPNLLNWILLKRKRLIWTTSQNKWEYQLTKRDLHFSKFLIDDIPPSIRHSMSRSNTNSGNQAIYSKEFIQKLVSSTSVKQLFAMSQTMCCCCVEEMTWIAAAFMIGYGQQALEQASMFQLWGGMKGQDCHTSLSNAILTTNETTCYNMPDATLSSTTSDGGAYHYVNGSDLKMLLTSAAHDSGLLFARKFQSNVPESVQLRQWIQKHLHS